MQRILELDIVSGSDVGHETPNFKALSERSICRRDSQSTVAGPPSCADDGEMIEMTLSSRHRIRNSSPGGLRPRTLPLGHRGSPQYWLSHVDGEEIFFVSSTAEPRTLAWKAAVLTTTLGPPSSVALRRRLRQQYREMFHNFLELYQYGTFYTNTTQEPFFSDRIRIIDSVDNIIIHWQMWRAVHKIKEWMVKGTPWDEKFSIVLILKI